LCRKRKGADGGRWRASTTYEMGDEPPKARCVGLYVRKKKREIVLAIEVWVRVSQRGKTAYLRRRALTRVRNGGPEKGKATKEGRGAVR